MLYSVASTVLAIIVACGLWIGLGWNDGASAVILAAVSCSFFAAMDDPAPQIYRFFFWTLMSVIFSSLYLFWCCPTCTISRCWCWPSLCRSSASAP